jgi:hypothetical protein
MYTNIFYRPMKIQDRGHWWTRIWAVVFVHEEQLTMFPSDVLPDRVLQVEFWGNLEHSQTKEITFRLSYRSENSPYNIERSRSDYRGCVGRGWVPYDRQELDNLGVEPMDCRDYLVAAGMFSSEAATFSRGWF